MLHTLVSVLFTCLAKLLQLNNLCAFESDENRDVGYVDFFKICISTAMVKVKGKAIPVTGLDGP
jgi:hypothetical protein